MARKTLPVVSVAFLTTTGLYFNQAVKYSGGRKESGSWHPMHHEHELYEKHEERKPTG